MAKKKTGSDSKGTAKGIGRWVPIGMKPATADWKNVNPRDVKPPAAVLMDCMGVGWGNRIRAFQARFSSHRICLNFGIITLKHLNLGSRLAFSHLWHIPGVHRFLWRQWRRQRVVGALVRPSCRQLLLESWRLLFFQVPGVSAQFFFRA